MESAATAQTTPTSQNKKWYNNYMNKLITTNPKILGGKPIIAGTRMSVESVLELLASDMEVGEILKEFPFLTKKQVQAAIQFAVERVES